MVYSPMSEEMILEGIVVHGKQLGRQLGYPTANLGLEELKGEVPPTGVYAARCRLADGRAFTAMVNVGFRPTVDLLSHRLSIEAHLLDFEGDLYGQRLQLSIQSRIRDERKMETIDELKAQLAEDLASAKAFSAKASS